MRGYLWSLLLICLIQLIGGGLVNREDPEDDATEEENDESMGLFKDFMQKYDKVYSDVEEFKKRLNIFRENLKKAEILQKNERGTAIYEVTKFSDLTSEEFKSLLGYKKPDFGRDLPEVEIPKGDIPKNFDWRHYKAVTKVKNQKHCGSCWAFSVVGNIEGQWAIHKKELLSLSEQQLLDCDHVDDGCNGGNMERAILQIVKMGGLELESDYPYEGCQRTCRLNKTMIRVKVSGMKNLPQNENDIAAWLYKNGPVSAGLNSAVMQHYIKGISHPHKKFCKEKLDHAVLIVGYGVDKDSKNPYWIIKNSWGVNWGEDGYYRLYRGENLCGISNYPLTSYL